MQAGADHEAIEIGVRRPVPTPVPELGPGEVGYLIAGIKDVGEARSGETVTTCVGPDRPRRSPATATRSRWCSAALFPIDGDDFENLRESAREAEAQRRVDHLRARVLGGARVRVPLRLPRPAAHGDRQGAPRARVQPGAHRHGAERRVPGDAAPTARSCWSTTRPTCPRPQSIDFIEEPYFRVSIITPKEYTGTLMDLCQTRRGDMNKLEYLSPERVELHLRDAARRGRRRLLRPDEDPHPGLRQPRLRAVGVSPAATS